MIFSPIFDGYLWREGSSEEHSQDWLCHKDGRREKKGHVPTMRDVAGMQVREGEGYRQPRGG
jgi:hypothetical protein